MQIVDTDAFTDMSNDAQLLYFRLCLAADDDGFVANPRRVMRSYGFSEDCMKLLIAKKFTLVMKHGENAVLLIKHWKMHNTIQRDRYKPSPYHELLRFVFLDKNNAYSLTPGDGKRPALPGATDSSENLYTDCIQDVYTDKVRLDKGRLEEESIVQDNNSFSLSSKEKEEEKEIPLSDEHAERVSHFARMVAMFKSRGFDASGAYALAATEGITREEIDAARAAEKADEST
jgi:hypothetical protein